MAVGIFGAIAIALGASPAWCLVLLLAGMPIPVLFSLWLSKKLEQQRN